jgi:hypothetical protein
MGHIFLKTVIHSLKSGMYEIYDFNLNIYNKISTGIPFKMFTLNFTAHCHKNMESFNTRIKTPQVVLWCIVLSTC